MKRSPMRRVSKKRQAKAKSDEGRAEQAYMLAVKRLPCCICGAPPPSDAHHTICGRYGSRKTSAYETIPLCKAHHQDGPDAIHNGKASWVAKYGPDTDYIAPTQKILRGEPL